MPWFAIYNSAVERRNVMHKQPDVQKRWCKTKHHLLAGGGLNSVFQQTVTRKIKSAKKA